MKVGVVGIGLIGGSFSLGIKKRRYNIEVVGIDKSTENLARAKELGIIDGSEDLEQAARTCDFLVLAIPVNAISSLLPRLLDWAGDHTAVVDFGSTKAPICEAVKDHPKRSHYISAHPIAGTEYSGPDAAFAELLEEKIMILCEEERSNPDKLFAFKELCKNLAMKMTKMDPVAHDLHLSYVSHLSHVTSFALSTTVLQKEQDEKSIFAMAGSGFASTVRLAKSNAAMWNPIFMHNKTNLSSAIGSYINQLKAFKQLLDEENLEGLEAFMTRANEIGDIIDNLTRKK